MVSKLRIIWKQTVERSRAPSAHSGRGGASLNIGLGEEERALCARLMERFPGLSEAVVATAVRAGRGHGGRAAALLRESGRSLRSGGAGGGLWYILPPGSE